MAKMMKGIGMSMDQCPSSSSARVAGPGHIKPAKVARGVGPVKKGAVRNAGSQARVRTRGK